MNKPAWLGTILFAILVLSAVLVPKADARKPYKDQWDAKYMKKGSPMDKALGGMSNCNICHQGSKKLNRNAYGKAIAESIGKNEKNVQKINDAILKAEGMKSDPSEEKSPTFGDLIKEGKLPVTKEEPKDE